MPLIYSEITLDLNWFENCAIVGTIETAQVTIYWITDTKLYVPVVMVSTQDNAKLLEQLKSDLKEQLTGINIKQMYRQKE